jgi:hypothetical protein
MLGAGGLRGAIQAGRRRTVHPPQANRAGGNDLQLRSEPHATLERAVTRITYMQYVQYGRSHIAYYTGGKLRRPAWRPRRAAISFQLPIWYHLVFARWARKNQTDGAKNFLHGASEHSHQGDA